jgi:hypothetical protein
MRLPLLLCALAVALPAAPIQAQARAVPPTARDTAGPVPGNGAGQPRLKSRSRAQALALGHTLVASTAGAALMSQGVESQWKGDVGYWLFAYGTVIAPSAGNFYADDGRRTSRGLLIRSAGSLLVAASVFGQLLTSPEFDLDNPEGGDLHWDAVNLTGAALMAGGAAYSILTAPRSVTEYNERLARAHEVRVAPALASGGAVGVQVRIGF